jgi:ClpP class serine protease
VGAAAVAVAYEGARSLEPKTRMEAPPRPVRGGKRASEAADAPKPTTPATPARKQPGLRALEKKEENEKPPVAKSDAELFYAQLLSQRRVFLNGRVDDKSAHGLIGKLLFLDQVDPETPIVLYINSGGGVVTSGLAIYDVMMHVRCVALFFFFPFFF